MCGIVGYVGNVDAKEILLKGLEKLEYRGYDSAGIALLNDQGIHIFKEKGRIADLRRIVEPAVSADIGIGHTRWATHGEPSRKNAHPHQSWSGRFTVVHNGVIENYQEIKTEYLQGITFMSDTDTEVIAHLMERLVSDGLSVEEAFRKMLSILSGSYATAVLDTTDREVMYVGKNKSPLLLGLGEGFHLVASDAMAAIQLTNEFVELLDEEMVIVRSGEAVIKNLDGESIQRTSFQVALDAADIEKGPYAHYMQKEMDEQPAVIRHLVAQYQGEDQSTTIPSGIREAIMDADRVYIVACGTSYHAGLVGKQLLETLADIPVEVHIASEFLYNRPLLSKKPCFIFISQSGETADSRGVLVDIKKLGHRTITITNVENSTLSREADYTLLTYAGPEIAVASTKAYTAQIAVLAILAYDVAKQLGKEPDLNLWQELSLAAGAMETVMNQKEVIERLVWEYLSTSRNGFFIGRGVDYAVCLEGALKLKEISYIHAEGLASGELKHGTIALIEQGTPVIALLTQAETAAIVRSNIQEVKARGAKVCTVCSENLAGEEEQFMIPAIHELLTPLISVIPMQLIAYYSALYRGCDIDKPRNLAKSVTVE